MAPEEHLARLFDRIHVTATGCWEWMGPRHYKGYGKTGTPGPDGSRFAHRVMYQYLVGPIPTGLVLDHVCENKPCINPRHLEPVTVRVNTIRACGSEQLKAAIAGMQEIVRLTG